MNFEWNENTIRWYQDAERYTGFYKNIARLVAPKMAGYTTLCDIGCGPGLVDIELSRYMEAITCIDVNPCAIAALERNIRQNNITNIKPLLLDCRQISENWDVIFLSFFGSGELERFLPHCKKLVAVVSKKSEPQLFPEKYRKFRKNIVEEVEKHLQGAGIPYNLTNAELEFGQPFCTEEDAGEFVRALCRNISCDELDEFLRTHLVRTGEEEFPFYLPHKKSVGIFEIEGKSAVMNRKL